MRPQIRMGVPTYVGKNELAVCTASWIGTLPRVWEKVICRDQWLQVCRYTPTYVGKNLSKGPQRANRKVHSHLRGKSFLRSGAIGSRWCTPTSVEKM